MRFGVVIFPGSNCEQDVIGACRYLGLDAEFVWHGDTDLSGFDAIVLAGRLQLRRLHPLRCGGALLPGDDRGRPLRREGRTRSRHLQRLPDPLPRRTCSPARCCATAASSSSARPWTCASTAACDWLDLPLGTVLQVPINHNEGNYICDAETLGRLDANGQVVLRYCEPDGSSADGGSAPNGALDDIAGICNERGNVFGLMPHPERVVDPVGGGTDGQPFFTTIVRTLAEVAG